MCAAAALADMRASGPGFDFYCTGNCTDVAPPTRAGMIFMGGGPDVDTGYKVSGGSPTGTASREKRAYPGASDDEEERVWCKTCCPRDSRMLSVSCISDALFFSCSSFSSNIPGAVISSCFALDLLVTTHTTRTFTVWAHANPSPLSSSTTPLPTSSPLLLTRL